MSLAPLKPQEILAESRASVDGVYVLGCLNRHITVYSQQVRAINLVDALRHEYGEEGHFRTGTTIAVIGAGVAGLTAAAYAARYGASVTVLEEGSRPLWLQDRCRNRWLHPRIYDWPEPGALEPRTDLPLLNWQAGRAQDVALEIRDQWDRELSSNARLLPPLYGRKVTAVIPTDGQDLLLRHQSCRDAQAASQDHFRFIILAVGFGIEKADGKGDAGRVSYWSDADSLEELKPGMNVLISGYGDGGLADLMRLCLVNFRQDQILRLVQNIKPDVGTRLLSWDRDYFGHPEMLNQQYENVEDYLVTPLREMRREGIEVTITGRGKLYGTTSAILNRFVVSQLQKLQGPAAFEVINEEVDKVARRGEMLQVTFKHAEPREFHRVVLRHGPVPALRNFDKLWEENQERKKRWSQMPQSLDRTRIPTWPTDNPTGRAEHDPLALLESYESSADIWCLVLHPPAAEVNWRLVINQALKDIGRKNWESLDRSFNANPLVLPADCAVRDVATYRRTVRALCGADIVVADVSGDDPAVMLLLGIRSAVRRGVTLVSVHQPLDSRTWSALPFNLKELNLLSTADENKRIYDLAQSIFEGLKNLSRKPRYLDLPVYDYVRELGATYDDYADCRHADHVLFLRPFDKPYTPDYWDYVKGGFRRILQDDYGLQPKLESIIDETSPRLVGQRLYEAIRVNEFCVVDWSLWRANVFYELGVRLAVNRIGPVCLYAPRCRRQGGSQLAESDTGTRSALIKLFSPFPYEIEQQTDVPIKSAVQAFFSMTKQSRYKPNGARLAHCETYQVANEHFKIEQERFASVVSSFLVQSVDATLGGTRDQQHVDLTQLYARDNSRFADRIRVGALERLVAAWCYLDLREAPYAFEPSDLFDPRKLTVFADYRSLGVRLTTWLDKSHSKRDKALRGTIDQRNAEMVDVAAFYDRLRDWARIKRDLAAGNPGDVETPSDLLESDIETLSKLLESLEGLNDIALSDVVRELHDDLFRLQKTAREKTIEKE